MNKGRIEIRKVDLMGYTAETQMFVVQNGGGRTSGATFQFLTDHDHLFDRISVGGNYLGLRAARIDRFKTYAESKGFEVVTT